MNKKAGNPLQIKPAFFIETRVFPHQNALNSTSDVFWSPSAGVGTSAP